MGCWFVPVDLEEKYVHTFAFWRIKGYYVIIFQWKQEPIMNIDARAQMAFDLKASGKCNCTQSVVNAFEDLLPAENLHLMQMTAGFAAGMGCMESTCGALIGAVLVAGALSEGKGTAGIARNLVSDFKSMCGATICKDLKGMTGGSILCECPDCCKNAVLALKNAGF